MYHRRIYLKGIYVFREEGSHGRACVSGGSVTWKGMSYWKMYLTGEYVLSESKFHRRTRFIGGYDLKENMS